MFLSCLLDSVDERPEAMVLVPVAAVLMALAVVVVAAALRLWLRMADSVDAAAMIAAVVDVAVAWTLQPPLRRMPPKSLRAKMARPIHFPLPFLLPCRRLL